MPEAASDISAFVREGTNANFEQLVIENSRKGLVMVDFYAPELGPCMRQREQLLRLVELNPGRFLLVSVDTTVQKALTERLRVNSLPTLMLFRRGEAVETFHGVQPQNDYPAMLAKYLPGPADAIKAEAARLWKAQDHDGAIRLLADAAMSDPDNLSLPAMLAKLLMQIEQFEAAHKVLAALPRAARDESEIAPLLGHLSFILASKRAEAGEPEAEGDAHAASFRQAAQALLVDDFDTALQALLSILRADRDWDGGTAQRGLLAVFKLLGDQHPLVQDARRELAKALS